MHSSMACRQNTYRRLCRSQVDRMMHNEAEKKISARQAGHVTTRNQVAEEQDDVSPVLRSVMLKDETI